MPQNDPPASPEQSGTDAAQSFELRPWWRVNRQWISAAVHAALFAIAWFLSFALAYNFRDLDVWIPEFFLPLLLPVVLIKTTVFVLLGLHRGWWRYVSLRDVRAVTRGAWLGFLPVWLLYYALQNFRIFGLPPPFDERFPDSVFLLDFGCTIALVCGTRMAVRLYYEEVRPVSDETAPRLLILGAGNAGENAVREILRMPVLKHRIVGFLDDQASKWGARIHGFEVFGPIDRVKAICAQHQVEEILIAMPSATNDQIRRVINLCQGTNVRFKTLPALSDLIAGRAKVGEIRNVEINDLLGRDPVQLDDAQISQFIRNRVIAVSGAGGSIGAEMCRQIVRFEPRRLILIEQAEYPLFIIERELCERFPDLQIVPCIADICDERRVAQILATERPSAVFHAAAHKHVPMMEHNPGEAIKNNVQGTRVVADAAMKFGCEKFVMISTDKAVNPTSIMGCTKRIAEMYIQACNDSARTEFITVRFGNVLGSSGSVVPIFRDQIARGGPVTVTHPEMVRYFMTIPEAAQLVLQSAAMGKGGEIFVLDMGQPMKIIDLARQMITLSGFRPEIDIKIEITRMRPGEKLFEELSIEGEDISQTSHPKIGIWNKRPVVLDWIRASIDDLVAAADTLSRHETRDRLQQIVPEFQMESPERPDPAVRIPAPAIQSPAAAVGTA
jgi:FlaA1/EpsC-like NDP-sugar epimerase